LRLMFMRMEDLLRARSTSRRMEPEPDEVRRDSSLWMPAFMAAAAASEVGGVCEVDGEWVRELSCVLLDAILEWTGEAEDEGEGGSELRSGGMVYAL
jgi:hypothetical protein